MDGHKSLNLERHETVVEVVLCGPSKGNALGPDHFREIPEVFAALDKDDGVRAVVVRGAGDHFTYGLDLFAMMGELGPVVTGSGLAAERTRLFDLIAQVQRGYDAIAACRKPVIAAVHGWCIGGGLDLIAACDIRLCAQNAKFSLRETRMAMVADLGSLQRLPAIIGQGNTRELALTGKDIDAQWALRTGLVNEVFDSPAQLLEGARALASEIARNAPLVVQGVKRVLNYCADKSTQDGLQYGAAWNAAFLQSNDLAEALAAFSEKRPPRFTGR